MLKKAYIKKSIILNIYIYIVEVVGNDEFNIDLTDTVLHALQ